MQEMNDAIKTINKGKAEDIFWLSIEHFIFAGETFQNFLLKLINTIFKYKLIPDILKTGLLSPIFKNKGEKTDSKNYRGIAVLPILLKIIEAILKVDLRNGKFYIQSPLQRGFTENASPLNAAIVLEEVYREYKDEDLPVFFGFVGCEICLWRRSSKNVT